MLYCHNLTKRDSSNYTHAYFHNSKYVIHADAYWTITAVSRSQDNEDARSSEHSKTVPSNRD